MKLHLLLLVLLSSLGLSSSALALDVVATVPTLAALAREIGGKHVDAATLALPTQDPHFVDAKPSLALQLNQADLLIAVGLDLEVGWLPALQKGARNPKINVGARGYLDCSTLVKVLDRPASVDRSQGDVHSGGNPHYLFDPRRLAQVAVGVAARMGELDPAHKAAFDKNLRAFLGELHKTRKALEKSLKPYQGTPIVAYHKSWVYLSSWLGLKEVAFLEPKPGIPPNPGHVASVLVKARRQKAKIIIQESYYPSAIAKLVAQKSGAKLVILPGGVDFKKGETVVQYLKAVVAKLRAGLQ